MENCSLRDDSQMLRGNLHLCPSISYRTRTLRQTGAPENVAPMVKWQPVCSMNLDKLEGQICGNHLTHFLYKHKKNKNKVKFNMYLKYTGELTVGIGIQTGYKIKARGNCPTKI